MALKWVIGDFATGEVTHDLPGVVRDAGVVRNIFGDDTADIQIVWDQLTNSQKNNWKNFFAPGERFVALIDTERTWSHRHAVLFAGYIAKCESPIGKGTFKIRATGLREYMASRYVLPYDEKVTNPEAKITFAAENTAGLLSRIAKRCFSQTSYPSGTPNPPDIVGDFPDSSVGTAVEWEHTWADSKTYDALLEEICADKRREVWFIPRWDDDTTERIVWDMEVVNPQSLGAAETHWLDSRTKLSSAGTYLDASNIFSRIWASAEDKSDDEKIILKPFAASSGSMSVLFERLENFEVPLTESDVNSRAAEYLSLEGNRIPQTFEATYEEVGVRGSMADYLGTLIRYRGIDGTISAGIDATMRVVAVEFSPRKESVTLTVQEPQVYYKRLPRPGRIGQDNTKGGRSRPPKEGGGGGGFVPTPPNPWEPGGRPPESTVIGQWGFGSGPVAEFPLLHNTPVKSTTLRTASQAWESSYIMMQESNICFAVQDSAHTLSVEYSTPGEAPDFWLPVLDEPSGTRLIYGSYLTNNGEWIDTQVVYNAPIVTQVLMQSISNFLSDYLVGGLPGRRIRKMHYSAKPGNAVMVGGKIVMPLDVQIIWSYYNISTTTGLPTTWSANEGYDEHAVVFIESSVSGYDNIEPFFSLIPETYTKLEWDASAPNSGARMLNPSERFPMQRLGEAQVIIAGMNTLANNNAVIIDLRPIIGEVNGPLQQWRIPNLPIHPTDGQLLITNIGYGMLETSSGLESALYIAARGSSVASSSVLLAHPTYANSMIPNTEDFSWVVRIEQTNTSSISSILINFSSTSTWYGRALIAGQFLRVATGTNPPRWQVGLVWNGAGSGWGSINGLNQTSGTASSSMPFGGLNTNAPDSRFSYTVWGMNIFRSDGYVYLIEWDV